MSKSSEIDQKAKLHILGAIDPESYGITCETVQDKVKFLRNTFITEYGPQAKHYNWSRQRALEEYFKGLPTACTIEFRNHVILELAEDWGLIRKDATESERDKILDRWWTVMAGKACQLFDGYRVPKEEE